MIYELTVSEQSQEPGTYNKAPKGWKEISEKDFARSMFFTYSPKSMEHRQVFYDWDGNALGEKYWLSITMFHMHDGTGFAMSSEWTDGKVRYFRFGCEHQYRGLSQQECRDRGIAHFGSCYHVSECGVCGHIKSIDSSD